MTSGSRSFDFGSDDVLCSYQDSSKLESSGPLRSDAPSRDFAMTRPLVNIYEQEGHHNSDPKEDYASIVENCMKKYADILMRSLDGISGRLSQLEMHCYKVERSVSELRADMVQNQTQGDTKFKSLEKHMQEVHRAVQILRDKQELVDTQKELAKLQMLQKEDINPKPTSNQTQTPIEESTKHEDINPKQIPNNQLALVPSQVANTIVPLQQDQYNPNPSYQSLPPPQGLGYQYVQTRPPVQSPQIMQQQQLAPKTAQFAPQYQQQQWAPQSNPNPNPQQFNPSPNPNPQQFALQTSQQAPPPSHPWAPQPNPNPNPPPLNPSPNPNPQQFARQTSQQAPPPSHPWTPQPNPNSNPQQFNPNPNPPQFTRQSSLQAPPPSQQYSSSYPPQTQIPETYPPFSKGGYANIPPYNTPTYNTGPYNNFPQNPQNPQMLRNSPYGEFIEKAVSMGYPRDQVVSASMKLAETGQHMDLNALLDRLNGGGSGSNQWSG